MLPATHSPRAEFWAGVRAELPILLGVTPFGIASVWVGSALVAWAAYRLVERRFERAELSMKPVFGESHTG